MNGTPCLFPWALKSCWCQRHKCLLLQSKRNRPDEMPLCVLAESGRVGFPAVHSSAVAVVHRQVHLRKMSYAGEIFCSYKFDFNTRLSWLVQVPNLRSHICSSKGNQVMSTWTRSIFQKTKDLFFQPCKWIERFRGEFVQQFHHCKLSKSWKVKVIPSLEKRSNLW